jgi:hypothetical protein
MIKTKQKKIMDSKQFTTGISKDMLDRLMEILTIVNHDYYSIKTYIDEKYFMDEVIIKLSKLDEPTLKMLIDRGINKLKKETKDIDIFDFIKNTITKQ